MQPHLKHVPGYLMPRIAAVGASGEATAGGSETKGEGSIDALSSSRVPFHKPSKRGSSTRGRGGSGGGRGGRGGHKRADPLKGGAFSFKPKA
mgnify:FL=1